MLLRNVQKGHPCGTDHCRARHSQLRGTSRKANGLSPQLHVRLELMCISHFIHFSQTVSLIELSHTGLLGNPIAFIYAVADASKPLLQQCKL